MRATTRFGARPMGLPRIWPPMQTAIRLWMQPTTSFGAAILAQLEIQAPVLACPNRHVSYFVLCLLVDSFVGRNAISATNSKSGRRELMIFSYVRIAATVAI